MTRPADLEDRLTAFVEHHLRTGETMPVEALCEGRPDLVEPLAALVREYLRVSAALDRAEAAPRGDAPPAPPALDGFRAVERLGGGGTGEVYKLEDLRLGRVVAAKVLRRDRALAAGFEDFLREARALALFNDRRIVQIHEFRPDADPPVIVMELVEGFELGKLGPSLEFGQRARIVAEVCGALAGAHALGLQHRDLKPSNIMLDAQLEPRLLDFGLSGRDPSRGHLRGTLPYLAPEQLDPDRPIDARADIYALGVILYELLCGAPPFTGHDTGETVEAIRAGTPRLPVEVDPAVPEPLQAIALKAMEREPAARYQSAREMAEDLRRFLDGRPVLARPTAYAAALGTRLVPHLEQIAEWARLKLIYPHEAARLRGAYRQLDRREDDWIVESRVLSYSQIALYLGAFFLVAGSLFYFAADRVYGAVEGVWRPFLVLGLPFLGLNLVGHYLYRREHQAVAVAFYLAGAGLLPLFLLILFHEAGLWRVDAGVAGQIFLDGSVSNRQLQLTTLAAAAWCGWLALRTRTVALSTVCTFVVLLLALAVAGDLGLRHWIDAGRWDRVALLVAPLVPVYGAAAWRLERGGRPWFSRPLYVGAAVLLVAVVELLALDGRLFGYLGVSLRALQAPDVSSPALIDTLTAMTVNGVLFYVVASLIERRGSEIVQVAAWLLFTITPFAVLEPLGYLNETGEYARAFDWFYLALAVTMAVLSHARQRKAFYYAGLINSAWALWLLADHYQWFDRPAWAITLVAAGLAVLTAGFALARRERRAD